MGEGLLRDEHKAVALYQKAADRGDGFGLAYLGSMHLTGKGGLARDEKKALELLRKAADLDVPLGLLSLGSCTMRVEGLAPDTTQALQLFSRAAEQGDSLGLVRLGLMQMRGAESPSRDEHKAAALFKSSRPG